MFMFDSATGAIPAGATDILVPTDGVYASGTAGLEAKFPNARFHTYSAVGLKVAEWIDVETGCVWPPATAVARWRAWRPLGCKGFYCATSTRPVLTGLLSAAELQVVEWFEADPTGVAHIRPGDAATQYLWAGSYDESETTPAFEGDPVAPAPVLPKLIAPYQVGDKMLHPIQIGPLDGNGNGWEQTTIPWSTFQAATPQGPNPATDGYWPKLWVGCQDRNNEVLVTVEGGTPQSTVTVFILASA